MRPVAAVRADAVPNGYLSGVLAEQACRNAGKRLCKIAFQVSDRFQTHCDPYQRLADAGALAIGLGKSAVRRRGRMCDRRSGITEIGGNRHHADRINDTPRELAL